ncbi:class I adenylate-forming enzyme family protein [Brevibacterium sp. CFH 10365]|uniref:class I adenylate-forming enzyme family protein n=1 Tax=Brevibacterium sp. CFH 10365 TaxID=2585207 RepID=UPI00126666F0|nr:class I adenylate-forming enzyme family protein [Brevibacterium sp. CFH 10365]
MTSAAEDITLSQWISSSLDLHASNDRTAYVTKSGIVTYAQFREQVAKAQSNLLDLEVTRGTRVGLVVDKTVESLAAFVGLILLGACPAVIDPRTPLSLLREQREVTELSAFVCEAARYEELLEISDNVASTSNLTSAPSCDLLVRGIETDDEALLLFTSGSTGRPKGVVLSHRAVVAHAAGVIERTELSSDDVLLHLMPIFHTNGVNNQIIAPLLAGAKVVLEERFQPKTALESLASAGPTIVTGVPTMLLRMLPHIAPDASYPSLRMVRCGSAPIKPEQVEEIEAAFGVPVVLSYGMSEATCTSTMNPPDRRKVGSVGTALAGQSVRIAKPGSTDPLPGNEDGEILIGGQTLMKGYLGAEGTNPVEDGWLHTGDLGHVDSDGYLTISGRLKDTIVRGGENISPATIEQVLIKHPSVNDVCVVGREHHDLGEVPVAYVSVTDTTDGTSTLELEAWVKRSLSRPFVPEQIQILDQLPVTPVGKIDRKSLAELDRREADTVRRAT